MYEETEVQVPHDVTEYEADGQDEGAAEHDWPVGDVKASGAQAFVEA